ncbi:MAG: alanine--glyoxylate aminotransferase family protein [Alphaproteobacteria bacterium]|nr:alanine--glyoxylate aminotransferase family protein [Alphaproteobacteria bacterium]
MNCSMKSFDPPRRVLMGPGPSDVHPRVLSALARPTVGHLDPSFITLMDEVKGLLQQAFMTKNELTLAVSGPGSAGMETCFVNLLEPGDTAIVAVNGVFGQRMKENVERSGAGCVLVEEEWGKPVDPDKVEQALKAHPEARVLAFVHAETSTGVESDAKTLCALARQYDALSIVDAVTSLGGIPVKVDEWRADAVYSGSQKCLSCMPGLSPVTFGPDAVERIRSRNRKVQSWFMDLSLVMGYWGAGAKRAYHHTAPINALYGLHEALLMLAEEGLEASWARHKRLHLALRAGLEAMGLSFLAAENCRLPQLNAVLVPDGVDEAKVRARMLERFGIELGAGLGPLAGKIWRIGLMGASCTANNVLLCLGALEAELTALQAPIRAGVAVPAAMAAL